MSGHLVSTQWLAERLGDENIRIADASWYMPQAARDPKAEYAGAHIPGAVFFDIEALSDQETTLPHMLAPANVFAAHVSALGIGSDHTIVVYDGAGMFSSPRAWWTLRAYGHEKVLVLDGGLPKWKAEDRPTDGRLVQLAAARFTAKPNAAIVRDITEVTENLQTRAALVLDARGAPRFTAQEAEPRLGVRGGHIPGSKNVHYARLLNAGGTMKSPEALRALFAEAHVDLAQPVITSCGTGVTAAILMLALEIAGAKNVALYDGSWTEWGSRTDTPVETG